MRVLDVRRDGRIFHDDKGVFLRIVDTIFTYRKIKNDTAGNGRPTRFSRCIRYTAP